MKKAADEYNKIAAVAAKAGIQQGLHNEGFELSMVDGKRVYDMLFDLLDPKLVKFQFQMSTITQRLRRAPTTSRSIPGRFISMHVQDVDMNAPRPPPPPPRRRSAGRRAAWRRRRAAVRRRRSARARIDWVKTFKAAKKGGVKNYFVEQNMELTKESVAALKAMKA